MESSKPDIQTNKDIVELVDSFYTVLKQDPLIGHFFNKHMSLSFEEHLPIMYSFWQSVLLGTASYKGNVMLAHIHLNKRIRLAEPHFERWITIWEKTVNSLFEGERAEEAKKRARLMKELMLYKITQSMGDGFIQ